MVISAEQQAKNAIQWIETLPSYRQAESGKRKKFGNSKEGYCCLGAGAQEILGADARNEGGQDNYSGLRAAVGLIDSLGVFSHPLQRAYGENALYRINDYTEAGFENISKLMRDNPHWMFVKEVADLIKEHYRENK